MDSKLAHYIPTDGLCLVLSISISHVQLIIQSLALLSIQHSVEGLVKSPFKQDFNCTSINCVSLTFWEFEGQEPRPGYLMQCLSTLSLAV